MDSSNLFQEFLQVFAYEGSPLIMFLDDLQWADGPTLRLMKLIGSRSCICKFKKKYSEFEFEKSPYIALITAYRSNEVSSNDMIGKAIEECKASIPSVSIELAPLKVDALNSLINSIFPSNNTMALAEVVMKKTSGIYYPS